MSLRFGLIGAVAAMLAGCAGGGATAPERPAATAAAPRAASLASPQVMAAAGLQGVIGLPAASLMRRFGEPRIDLVEGDARKLQFAGATCVFDIYLYPLTQGAEPSATHVEARIRQGGAAADPGACIRELERR